MKQKNSKLIYWLGIIFFGILLGFSIQFVSAWTEPTSAPPNGNVGAPINTSDQYQYKLGNLMLNSNGTWLNGLIVANGNVGIGTLNPAQKLHVTGNTQIDGAIVAPEGTLRDDGGGWIRTYGATGWYSQTYGGGWYMTDTTWLRAYGDKNIYTPNTIQAGANMWSPIYYDLNNGGYYVDPNGTSRMGNIRLDAVLEASTLHLAADARVYLLPRNGNQTVVSNAWGGNGLIVEGPTWHSDNWLYNGYMNHNGCYWTQPRSSDYMECANGYYVAIMKEEGDSIDNLLCCRL